MTYEDNNVVEIETQAVEPLVSEHNLLKVLLQ